MAAKLRQRRPMTTPPRLGAAPLCPPVRRPGPLVADALRAMPRDRRGRVLICGSLYLAGEVLKLDA